VEHHRSLEDRSALYRRALLPLLHARAKNSAIVTCDADRRLNPCGSGTMRDLAIVGGVQDAAAGAPTPAVAAAVAAADAARAAASAALADQLSDGDEDPAELAATLAAGREPSDEEDPAPLQGLGPRTTKPRFL
jgi:hypothetical protein